MPELPEVETVRTGLENTIRGATIRKVTLKRANLRIPFPEDFGIRLEGRKISAITRRAKYLLFYLDKSDVLLAHLGMTGRFSVLDKMPKKCLVHDHVILELTDGRAVIYNDARRFGLMTLAKQTEIHTHPLLAALGPEPMEKGFTTQYLKGELAKRGGPVKAALMDQNLVVGVGNIYASEALFLAGINPLKPAKNVADSSAKLINSIRKVLGDAIASGGSSLKDFVQVSGETGYFQHHFNVYKRTEKPCFICTAIIKSQKISGRSTFFCPSCQR